MINAIPNDRLVIATETTPVYEPKFPSCDNCSFIYPYTLYSLDELH